MDSWLHRLTKTAFGRGAFEGVADASIFDSDAMAGVARQLIEKAASIGDCVIVGRGGQCMLQGRSDVFHVYVYAPLEERPPRARKVRSRTRHSGNIRASDRERAAYVKHHYQCEWCNPHLYDAIFTSALGEDNVAEAALAAMCISPDRMKIREHAHAQRP